MSATDSAPEASARSDGALRVVVAADVAFWRGGICRLLEDAGLDVVAAVADAGDALDAVAMKRPDVVVANLHRNQPLPDIENVRVARHFRERYPNIGLVILAREVRAATALELLGPGYGGIGYLLTDHVEDVDTLIEVVRDTVDGRSSLDPTLVRALLERVRRGGNPLLELTPREREVLALMAEGRSNQGIARRLYISNNTVEKHVRALFAKLGIDETPDDHRRVRAVLTYLEDN